MWESVSEFVDWRVVTSCSAALFFAFVAGMIWRAFVAYVLVPWRETSRHTARCLCGYKTNVPRKMAEHVAGLHPGFDADTRFKIMVQYRPELKKEGGR